MVSATTLSVVLILNTTMILTNLTVLIGHTVREINNRR
jgi:hypothetical protein